MLVLAGGGQLATVANTPSLLEALSTLVTTREYNYDYTITTYRITRVGINSKYRGVTFRWHDADFNEVVHHSHTQQNVWYS